MQTLQDRGIIPNEARNDFASVAPETLRETAFGSDRVPPTPLIDADDAKPWVLRAHSLYDAGRNRIFMAANADVHSVCRVKGWLWLITCEDPKASLAARFFVSVQQDQEVAADAWFVGEWVDAYGFVHAVFEVDEA